MLPISRVTTSHVTEAVEKRSLLLLFNSIALEKKKRFDEMRGSQGSMAMMFQNFESCILRVVLSCK